MEKAIGIRRWKRRNCRSASQKRASRSSISRLFLTDLLARDPATRLRSLEQCGFLLRKIETYKLALQGVRRCLRVDHADGRPRLAAVIAVALPPSLSRNELTKPSGDGAATAVVSAGAPGDAGRPRWRATLGAPRIDELRQISGTPCEPLADIDGPKGYDTGADPRIARRTAPLLAGLGHPGRPAHQSCLRRAPAGACSRSHESLLVGLAIPTCRPTSSPAERPKPSNIGSARMTHGAGGLRSFATATISPLAPPSFNHTAAMGALLGGALIDAPLAMGDGRHCLEHLLLRFWAFLNGPQRAEIRPLLPVHHLQRAEDVRRFCANADRPPDGTHPGRSNDPRITVYHPALRGFVAASGRAPTARRTGRAGDGIYGALHTVSKASMLKYVDHMALIHAVQAVGARSAGAGVALQTLHSPWAPSWAAGLIDDKPVPFEETSPRQRADISSRRCGGELISAAGMVLRARTFGGGAPVDFVANGSAGQGLDGVGSLSEL